MFGRFLLIMIKRTQHKSTTLTIFKYIVKYIHITVQLISRTFPSCKVETLYPLNKFPLTSCFFMTSLCIA